MCRKVKRVAAKTKGKVFDKLYEKLDTKEKRTCTDWPDRDRVGKDVQQIRIYMEMC